MRKEFLSTLKNRLINDTPIDLDFVYGNINEMNKFIPLDGQQRLTTLFLLHWYLGHKEGFGEDLNSLLSINNASKFSYETRISSKDFCNALVKNGQSFFDNKASFSEIISKEVKNSNWYYLSWNSDPSISSMLNMLDDIERYFSETQGLFSKLSSLENPIITFQFLNLQDLKMTDDLYIKMNARGKPLTDFENFKARFEKFLDDKHPDKKNEFAKKIDGIWCDLFWDFCDIDNGEKVDTFFINFFDYISEILFYKQFQEGNYSFENFETIENIYENVENVDFLFKSLDLFHTINSRDNINDFFNNLFSSDYQPNKVRMFDFKENLFEVAIRKNSFDLFDKLLLFSVINYLIKSEKNSLEINDNLKDYVRVCRNYLLKRHQKGNQATKDVFRLNIRTQFFFDILQNLELFFDENSIYGHLSNIERNEFNVKGEIFKAEAISLNPNAKTVIHKLEDHKFIKGDLVNFESIISNSQKVNDIAELFYDVFNVEDNSLIIRSLFAIDDYSIHVGDCYFGSLYTFGVKEKWHRILTDRDNKDRLTTILEQYFDKIKVNKYLDIKDSLNQIVEEGLKNTTNDIIKLFLKYPIITSGNDFSLFSFNNNNLFEVEKINGTSLRSYHINAFILAVLHHDSIHKKAPKVSDVNTWVTNTEKYWIALSKKSYFFPENNYWRVYKPNFQLELFEDKFRIEKNSEGDYLLFPNEKYDFVEVAVEFLNMFFNR